MKRFKSIALLGLAALLLLSACGDRQESNEKNIGAEAPAESSAPEEAPEAMPDSVLYYGEVLEIITSEDGSIKMISMNSPKDGEMVMNVGPQSFWINSGEMKADDPSTLAVGDRMYVFHSPITTMSLPPQSAAFAIVRNIPMDARCAMYHELEALEESENGVVITTDNGSMKITADKDTIVSSYDGTEAELSDLKEGGHIMVIYEELMNQPPADPRAFHILLLPEI